MLNCHYVNLMDMELGHTVFGANYDTSLIIFMVRENAHGRRHPRLQCHRGQVGIAFVTEGFHSSDRLH